MATEEQRPTDLRRLAEVAARYADHGWPVIDMTRRSIEEAAAAIINLFNDRVLAEGDGA